MANIKLNHLRALDVVRAKVFNNVNSFDEMNKQIIVWGNNNPDPDSLSDDSYGGRTGAAFEVLAEFFGKRYFKSSNPKLGLLGIEDTSTNKFNPGIDFTSKTFLGEDVDIQVKFRSNPVHKFTSDDVGKLIEESFCKYENIILFANVSHDITPSKPMGFFHFSAKAIFQKIGRIFDRNVIESYINRDPSFWDDFRKSLKFSTQKPKYNVAPALRTHQVEMSDAIQPLLSARQGRGRIICATGGGKTRVEYEAIHRGFFKEDFILEVLVAPTISLLSQHHETFTTYDLFHKDNVVAIHFHTGDDPPLTQHSTYRQTTNVDELKDYLEEFKGRKILILVTYASEEKLFDALTSFDVRVNLVVWDEFHHAVKQCQDYKQHILTVPVDISLFFSASEKRGRVISSTDESIFGKKLIDIPYSRMRNDGILVPKVIIKPIRINTKSKLCLGLEREMKKLANRDGYDLQTAVVEAAAIVVAYKDMEKTHPHVNMLTFGKRVDICKTIASSPAIHEMLPNVEVNAVFGSLPTRKREEIFSRVRTSASSILCQHSIVKEGIDLTAFNCLIFSRHMEVIGTQQALGRIVRANKGDTINLQNGKISLDNPAGWEKYVATVYVVVDDEDMSDFKLFLRELIEKLRGTGLTDVDYQFADIVEERHSAELDENNEVVPFVGDVNITSGQLQAMVAALIVEMETMEDLAEERARLKSLSTKELWDLL